MQSQKALVNPQLSTHPHPTPPPSTQQGVKLKGGKGFHRGLTEKRHLESRAMQLMQDNKALVQTVQQVSRQREAEVKELRAQLSKVRVCYCSSGQSRGL